MCYRFGLPTFFFTFAPDYTDPLTIRMSISNINIFTGFPSEDDGFVDALRDWDERARPDNIPFSNFFYNDSISLAE